MTRYAINGRPTSRAAFFSVGGTALLLFAVVLVGGYALTGWLVMLVLGALHHSVSEAVPALGFGPSVIVGVAITLVSNLFRR